MQIEPKILQSSDLEQILALERKNLLASHSEPVEIEMAEWHAPWRQEALEHYLPLGWSFGLWEGGQLVAYFLAQPQLFINAMTQSLWVEHLCFSAAHHPRSLLDIAYRLCREKHFQALLFKNSAWAQYVPGNVAVQPWDEQVHQVKTAKF